MHELISAIWGRMSRTTAIGPHRVAASVRRGPVLWLTICGGVLVAAIIVGTIAMVGEFRERALSNGERELENTVLLLARHFDQQLEDSEVVANDLISQMQISGIASPAVFKEQMSTTEAALMTNGASQLYLSLGELGSDGAIAVRLYHKPLVLLIWFGCVVMVLGGALSLSDRRLRVGAPKPARKVALQPAE